MINYKSLIFFSLMSLFLVVSFWFSHEKNSQRKNDEIAIYFTDSQLFFDPSLVNKLLTQNPNEQSNELKESLDLNMLETQLNQIPEVKRAEVFRLPKGALAIEITERKPQFIVDTHQRYYSDASGAVFTFRSIDSIALPVFKTDSLELTLPTTADLIVKLRKDELLENELETLYLENHEYILDLRSFPFQVVLGDSTQLKNKLEKLKIFCAFQTSQDSLIGYDKINLSYKNQVVATTL